ncbi:hypothetical protein AMK31_36865 [Streptomyces sp. TSRI0107]|nr:hypothetical protein AMK31_36865 [Streptomyces sp. TSRI0107]
MPRPKPEELPAVGTVMVDVCRTLIGEFRGVEGDSYCLRPLGGGREWTVNPRWVQLATEEDKRDAFLRARRSVPMWGVER